jgi:hypothetical protein
LAGSDTFPCTAPPSHHSYRAQPRRVHPRCRCSRPRDPGASGDTYCPSSSAFSTATSQNLTRRSDLARRFTGSLLSQGPARLASTPDNPCLYAACIASFAPRGSGSGAVRACRAPLTIASAGRGPGPPRFQKACAPRCPLTMQEGASSSRMLSGIELARPR